MLLVPDGQEESLWSFDLLGRVCKIGLLKTSSEEKTLAILVGYMMMLRDVEDRVRKCSHETANT
jgi:hypothetical protein